MCFHHVHNSSFIVNKIKKDYMYFEEHNTLHIDYIFVMYKSFGILADRINLGLTKMAEACPGSTKSSLEDIQA